jgi:mutator protein MutT
LLTLFGVSSAVWIDAACLQILQTDLNERQSNDSIRFSESTGRGVFTITDHRQPEAYRTFFSKLWLRLPAWVRHWTMRLSNTKFTVTAAALVFNDQGEVLLLKHAFRAGSGWGMPGGFMEADEQPEQTLRRELREEVGIEISDVRVITARSFDKVRQIEIVFVCRSQGHAKALSVEVERAEWFRLESLPEGVSSFQKKLIEAALTDGANWRN